MNAHKIYIRLSMIFGETCFFFLLYFSIIKYTGNNIFITPLFFFVAAGLIGIINILLSYRRHSLLSVMLINLALIAALEMLVYLISGKVTLSLSGVVPAYHVILFQMIFVFLLFRSIYLSYKKKLNVYGHFDFFIIFTFIIFLVAGLMGVTITDGIVWSIAVYFFNLLPLYVQNHSDENQKLKSGWALLVAALIFLLISNGSYPLLHNVSGTAGTIFDFLKTIFLAVLNALFVVIVFILKHTIARRARDETGSANPSSQAEPDVTPGPGASPLADNLLHIIIIGLFLFVMAIVFSLLLYYLLRALIAWLMKQQVGEDYDLTYHPFIAFKKKIISILKFFAKKFKILDRTINTLTQFGMPISIYTAYSQLLKWGARKRHPRIIHETPNEYCARLTNYYPDLKQELKEITDLYVFCSYSENSLSESSYPKLKPMLRKIYFYNLLRLKKMIGK